MSIELKKGGKFILRTQNEELRDLCKVKKKDGKFVVVDKSKNKLHEAETRDEANEFFAVYSEPEFIISSLRKDFSIEEGATVGDLVVALNKYKDLMLLMDHWYPFWRDYKSYEEISLWIAKKKITINDGELKITSCNNYLDIETYKDTPICLSEEMEIVGDVHLKTKTNWCLFELLNNLFENEDQKDTCKLTKDGLSYEGQQVSPDLHLLDYVEIEENTTLGNIFKLVEENEDLKDFIAQYSWCNAIDQFHSAAKEKPKKKSCCEYLQVKKYGEKWNYGTTISDSFGGIGIATKELAKDYHAKEGEELRFSVSCTPMSEIAHLPVVIEENLSFTEWSKNVKPKLQLNLTSKFTLLEFLDAIYWDISFYGGPEDSAEILEDLKERVEDFESGNIEGKSYSDVKDMLKDLKEKFENGDDLEECEE